MKTEKITMSMWRYTCYTLIAMMLLCCLTFLLTSCEKDLPEGADGSGKKVTVHFSVSEAPYSGGSGLRGGISPESEAVVFPVSDDSNWSMYATLEPVSGDRLRANGDGFADGAKLIIAAYKVTGGELILAAYATYKVSGGNVAPDDGEPPLEVREGYSYKFAAFSYNSNDVPPFDPETGLTGIIPTDVGLDLLYGISEATVIDSNHSGVNIRLNHKFSRVTVSVTTASVTDQVSVPTISSMGGVMLRTTYAVNLDIRSGALTNNGESSPTFMSNGGTDPTTWVSYPHTVYTAQETPTSFLILSVTLTGDHGSITMENLKASFAMSLLPGCEYVLRIDFKQVNFAGSNIYWVTTKPATSTTPGSGYMTFDGAGATANGMYQGLLFKWGSLVGISGAKTASGEENFLFGTPGNPTTGTPIYVPDFNNGGYIQTNASSMGWTGWGGPNVLTPHDIPYIPEYSGSALSPMDLSDDVWNTQQMWRGYRGDICQYIDPNYRMPAEHMFGVTTTRNWGNPSEAIGWYRSPSSGGFVNNPDLGDAEGKGAINSGAITYRGVHFPASGGRELYNTPPAALDDVNSGAKYWTSMGSPTAGQGGYASSFSFNSGQITSLLAYRSSAAPIRCVKKY